jgi:SAM-dependent methyltransferase
MDITNQYLLDCATEIAKQNPAACILDFGCGNGAVVSAGRQRNLDIYGAEVFYGGSAARSEVERAGLLGTVVREIQNGVAEFDDASFDLVMNNQVFEHVADLDSVLQETARLLKPTGLLLSIFPAIDVIREGHIGIPFAHWFPKRSRKSRFLYTYGLRCLGLGKYKDNFTSRAEWVRFELEWLDTYSGSTPTHITGRKSR